MSIFFKFLSALFLFSLMFVNLFSQGRDTIVTLSGDKLIGEIQSMNKGVLTFETDYSDSDFQIDWMKIRAIQTSNSYKIQDNNGNLYLGLIKSIESQVDTIILLTIAGEVYRNFSSISKIEELDEKFKDRLSLGIFLGYSYTKASGSQQISIRSNAGYRSNKWALASSINSFDNRIGEEVTSRSDANLNFRHLLANNWFAIANVDLLNSDEQQIELRTTGAAGVGNYLVRNLKLMFLLYGGIAYNNEAFMNTEEDNLQSMEGFIAGQYDLFGGEDLALITNFVVYPSLTEKNRIRGMYKLDLVWDLIYDFEAKLGFTLNYDSNPPNEAEKSDYVVSLTLGWTL